MLLCFVLVLQPMSGFVYGDDLSGAGPVDVLAEEGIVAGAGTASEPVLLMGDGPAAEDDVSISDYVENTDAKVFTIKDEVELRYLAELVNGTAGTEGRALLSGMGAVGGTTPGAIGFVESTTPGAMGFAVSTTPGGIGFMESTTPGAMSFATSSTPSAISFAGKTIKLVEDIALEGGDWIPIGTEENPFDGSFDGDGYTIKGLVIDKGNEDYQGLFGYAKDAVIKNVTVKGTVTGGDYAGSIVGFLDGGTIQDCASLVKIQGNDNKTGSLVGAIGEETVLIGNSFSYVEYGEEESIPPLCNGEAEITNSYYLTNDEDDEDEQAKNKDAFKYGEVAYLLEGGDAMPHYKVWTQGDNGYPVFGTNSVYKLTLVQPESVYEAGTVSFVKPEGEAKYKVFDGIEGKKYTYLPGDGSSSVELEAKKGDDFITDEVLFTPAGIVNSYDDETQRYKAVVQDQDVELSYSFWGKVKPDYSWYWDSTNNKAKSSPYSISEEGQLLALANIVNDKAKDDIEGLNRDDFANKTIYLKADIKVTSEWTPIGDYAPVANVFKGTFDGEKEVGNGNYTITYQLGSETNPVKGTYLGLFGYYSGNSASTVIKNLNVNGKVYAEGQYVGGIVGYAKGGVPNKRSTISNCIFQGEVNGQVTTNGGLGGVLGASSTYAYINNCINHGTIKGVGSNVGGVIGYASASSSTSIYGNRNTGSVAGTGDNVGGIIGQSLYSITDSNNEGSVTGNSSVGGIVGYTTFKNASTPAIGTSMNKGSVTGTSSYVGGIAGQAIGTGTVYSIVSYSYNLNEEIKGTSNVGSILGGGTVATVDRCFSYTIPETTLLLSGEGVTITNSYYLSDQDSGDSLSAFEFKYGKAAWLLDGGSAAHANKWTQGIDYPVLGSGSVYRLILLQPTEPYPEGSVTLGAVQSEDPKYINWPSYTEGSGACYYLPTGLSIVLDVDMQNAGTPEENELVFIPADKVTKGGETDPSYTVLVNDNISLSYEFFNLTSGPVGGAWYNDGAGDAAGKFIVETEDDLRYLAKLVAGTALNKSGQVISYSFSGKTVELGQDIALSNKWTPIGTSTKPFMGTFDGKSNTSGNNHTISGLDVVSTDNYQGLFGYTSDGSIKNLNVSGSVSGTGDYLGGIVGYAYNTALTNCHFVNALETEPSWVTGRSYVGGLAGFSRGMVSACSNGGNVTGTTQKVGGIAGYHERIGATIIRADKIEMSHNEGIIAGGNTVGGIVGETKAPIENCDNRGAISGGAMVGGIVGIASNPDAPISIKKTYNAGNVAGTDNYVGGIVGDLSNGATVENSYNLAQISGAGGAVGGIAGRNKQTIKYSFSLHNQIRGDGGSGEHSYYLVSDESEDTSLYAKKAAAFQYGEVAYLLDGGVNNHSNIWTQGGNHPVLKSEGTTGSIYKLTLEKASGSKNEAGTVELTEPPAGSGYKIFKDEKDASSIYIPVNTEIQLNAVRNPEFENYWLEFNEKNIVSWVAEEEDKIIYQATMPERDITISWRFVLPVESKTDWYDPAKNDYTISTYPELLGLAELVNGEKLDGTPVESKDFSGKIIKLGDADIEVTSSFKAIGTAEKPFTGTFNGSEKTISGLVIASNNGYQGVFGYTRGATIKNLTLKGNIKSSGDYVGGIVGYAENTVISACHIAVDEAETSRIEGKNYIGGIAGYIQGATTITGSSNAASINGTTVVGGIAGKGINASITDCINEGKISGGNETGGIVGDMNGTVKQCTNTGAVTEKGATSNSGGIGGIAGKLVGGISDSFNQGEIYSVKLYVGGISGILSSSTVTRLGNIGAITTSRVGGGIAGKNEGTINHSYNRGVITGLTDTRIAGGITGENSSQAVVKYCYSYGDFSGTAKSLGGITGGGGYSNNVNCYYSSKKWPGVLVDKDYVTDMNEKAFAGGEVAWLLDGGKELSRKGIWGLERGENGFPIFADDTHRMIFKTEVEENSQGSLVVEDDYQYFMAGETVTIIVTPALGQMLKQINIRAGSYKIVGDRTDQPDGCIRLTFSMPEADVRISAEFIQSQTGTFKIKFDANGGMFSDGEEIAEIEVSAGKAVTRPGEPTQEGHVFLGWYTEAKGGEKYDFTVSVIEPLTLFAHWKEAGKIIVTIDANGGLVNGVSVYELTLDEGDKVPKPPAPQWSNGGSIIYTFVGWFEQRQGGEEWNFETAVQKDLNLYAQWSRTDGFLGGTTAETAFPINDVSVLKELAEKVNNGESYIGKHFKLSGDIELDGTWESIGRSLGLPFQGHFIGNNRIVSLNNVQAPLFRYVGAQGEVKDLVLRGDFKVTGDNMGTVAAYNWGKVSGIVSHVEFAENTQSYIGGIIGRNRGEVSRCENHGGIYGRQYVGGIIGIDETGRSAGIVNCFNYGQISGRANDGNAIEGIGGIVGGMDPRNTINLVENSENHGKIVAKGNLSGIGGIIGCEVGSSTSYMLIITNSRNFGEIEAEGNSASANGRIGGLIGGGNRIYFEGNSGNEGEIRAESLDNVGGLVGNVSYGVFGSGSYNTGEIAGMRNVGGLLGSGGSEFRGCYNTGDVTALGSGVGGLVGSYSDIPAKHVVNGYALLNCYSIGKVSGTANVAGLIGWGSGGAKSGIINSFWYGEHLTATAESGVIHGISNTSSEFNKNNFYGINNLSQNRRLGAAAASQTEITDVNDGGGSTRKSAEQFVSGEVAYLLDGGEGSHENIWSQDDDKGHPVLKEASSYYKITTEIVGSEYGTVQVISKRTGWGENYAHGDPDTQIYAENSSTIEVTATPNPSVTGDGVTYSYSLAKLVVIQNEQEVNITDLGQFDLASDAIVRAVFQEVETKPVIPPPGGGVIIPPGGTVPVPPDGIGGGSGTGSGTGTGTGAGDGDGGIGTGSGGGIGNGNSDGQDGTSDRTTSANGNAPSEDGQEVTEPLVIAQPGELTTIEKNTGDQKDDPEQGGSPAGGGGGEEDIDREDEENLTVFEIVRNVVKENPIIVALVSIGILGILAAAGWRRYRKNLGDR